VDLAGSGKKQRCPAGRSTTSPEPSGNPSMTPLTDGASIGVIGAGPAGTFFALHLQRMLKETGRSVRITLFDRKTFDDSGPSGCNMCAGAIGRELVQKLQDLGLPLDEKVIQRIADGYEIHGRDVSVNVVNPGRGTIYTVFRGGGPVSSAGERKSFDQFLLDATLRGGAEFLHERVESAQRIRGGFRVGTAEGQSRDFDFLVGAFGVNSAITKMLVPGYIPPRTWHTVQAELPADNEFIRDRLSNRIHIVPAQGKAIRFLAITPKDNFLTLTGIGEHVRIRDLERERKENPILLGLLPPAAKVLCHCHPKVPVGTARSPFSERVAIVGDAFISRYLKNGIESSFDTSRILADTVVRFGVSEPVLRNHFYRTCIRQFRYDNFWGKTLFGIYEGVLRKGRFSDAFLKGVVADSAGKQGTQAHILWSVFAGDAPYREIAREAFAPRSVYELSRNILFG
jgi:flavin-dependent dehydrogenase